MARFLNRRDAGYRLATRLSRYVGTGAVARIEAVEMERRERIYRGGRPPIEVRYATVLLIDDGLATGATMRAAVRAVGRGVHRKCAACSSTRRRGARRRGSSTS